MHDQKEVLKIVLIYFFFGCAWIYCSDTVASWLIQESALLTRIAIFKGFLFIVLTSGLLYLLITRQNNKINSSINALRKSEERLQFLVQNTSDNLVILNADGSQRYVSPAARHITGYAPADLEGKTLAEIIHPKDLPDVTSAWEEAVRYPERTVSVQYRHIHKHRKWVHVEAVAQSFLDQPAIRGIIASIRDISERKSSEEALKRKDALLNAILRNLPFDFWARDTEQELIMQSNQSIALWGDLLHGKESDQRVDKTPEHWRANNRRALAGEVVVEDCVRVLHADEERIFHNIIAPIRNDSEILGILGINIDITEQQRAFRELQTTNELLSLFIKHSPIYAFIKEVSPTTSRTLHASENYKDMIGIPGSQMVGKTMQDLFPPEFAEKITADDWQVTSSGEILRLDEDLHGRHYATIKFPLRIGGKDFLAGYTIDITERKRAEEELRRRENELQKILEILPIGLWFADKNGTLLRGNKMGVLIWGAEPKVPLSEVGIFKAWRLPSREPVQAEEWALVKTIRDGATIVDELLEIEAFDGKRKTILNYSTPLLDDHGNIEGAILLNLDISDRKALEDQLLQAQKMESIGRLAGGVAHDFNNMLSVILGHAELALDALAPAQPPYDALKTIRDAAQRSANLTQQLLGFARKQTIAPKVIDFNRTIEGMLNMVQRLIGENIEVEWRPGDAVGQVNMDPSQLDQILVNLCINARDAVGESGKVTIETGSEHLDAETVAGKSDILPGEYVSLAVSDNGCGMEPATLTHLFEPYFTTKETGKGTGLGLATVYGIVRQNSGFIRVESSPGQGSAFRIYLPMHPATTYLESAKYPAGGVPRGKETILLVEDEALVLNLTLSILQPLGYTVLPASSPGEALRLARDYNDAIHLLMTDVIMPEMNGKDLAIKLLPLFPGLRCLFMSGYTADVIADHGVLDESVHFLQKPFSPKVLAAKVRQILDEVAEPAPRYKP